MKFLQVGMQIRGEVDRIEAAVISPNLPFFLSNPIQVLPFEG